MHSGSGKGFYDHISHSQEKPAEVYWGEEIAKMAA